MENLHFWRFALFASCALFASACGSSSEDDRQFATGCGSLTGSFSVTERRESGTCPVTTDPYVVRITETMTGAEVVFEELGVQCPGTYTGCALKGNTALRDNASGTAIGSLTIDLTLAPQGLQGSYSVDLNPGATPDAPDGCSGRFVLTGTRR